MISSFDAGRGCPFLCSFCTIINVQGRKSRYRTADDVERIVRANKANGVRYFFITDDNLARNRNWEDIFDRLIALRQEGLNFRFVIQVDTMCHKIPRFVEKAAAAGVKRVFIGLENINPDSLSGAKKKQNHISDYREMLLAWRKVRCITYCGYIVGFPNDTPESIVRDIKVIQRELPLDILQFSCLTPLPGSEDHAKMTKAGAAIDPDLNKVDLEHVVSDHPRMGREEWQDAYHLAWRTYYTDEHMKTVIRRAAAGGPRVDTVAFLMVTFWAASTLYNIYPLEAGLLRRKYRLDRRPSLPIENPLVFYPREAAHFLANHMKIAVKFAKIWWFMRSVLGDPNSKSYTDEALRTAEDYDHQELYRLSASPGRRRRGRSGSRSAGMRPQRTQRSNRES
jgi:DNA repair photolyase